jgi:hypothetical protein
MAIPAADEQARAWRNVERWVYTTPLGRPVVPDV